jgi:hypothetical protein
MKLTSLFAFALIAVIYVNYFPTSDGQGSLYTRRELEAIKKFRPMVAKHLTEDFMKKDRYLLRFLRSYDFDLEKAARRLEYSVNYRREKKIDGILDEDLRAHAKHLPFRIGEVDREGYPFDYLPWGKWDLRKYILAGKRDIILRAQQQVFERSFQNIWEVADKTGKDVDQYHLIVDMEGFHTRQNLCLGCIPLTMEMAAAYDAITPVFGRKLTLVNTPRSFTPILNLLRSTFPFPPVSLLTPYDNNADVWKKELLKDISPDRLIKKYGGTKEG